VIIDKVIVRGNALTSTALIKDRVALEPGDVFTLKRQKKSLNRLHKLNIFRSVTIEMLEPSIPDNRKTIVVEVVENKPQFLGLKAGASTADGVRGSIEYAYRNLFGYAVDFHFRIALNYRIFFVGVTQEFRDWYLSMSALDQLERNIGVGLTLPHLPKVGNWMTLELSFAHLRKNANIYGITTNALTGSILTGTGKKFNLTFYSGLESSSINANTEITEDIQSLPACGEGVEGDCINIADKEALRIPQTDKPATFVVSGARLNLDFRDNPFNPTKGFSLNAALGWIISSRSVDTPGTPP
jgi:outer membrane protein assembly factor BamA